MTMEGRGAMMRGAELILSASDFLLEVSDYRNFFKPMQYFHDMFFCLTRRVA